MEAYLKPVQVSVQGKTQWHQQPPPVCPELQKVVENLSTHPLVSTLMQSLFQLAPNQPAG